MEYSIDKSDVPCTFRAGESGEDPDLAESCELLTAVVRVEKILLKARRAAGMSDDQKWRLVCAGSLIGVAKSHLKVFSGR